jgi:hypothetical protein
MGGRCRQGQPPRRRQADIIDLPDDCRQCVRPQPLLQRPQHLGQARWRDQDQLAGGKAHACQRRRIQLAAFAQISRCRAPQNARLVRQYW